MANNDPVVNAEEFQNRLSGILLSGLTSHGLALGAELGLFDLMPDQKQRFTSEELADAGGFKERYVREWLAVMVCSHMVELDRETEKFYVLPEKRQSLVGVLPVGAGAVAALGGQRHENLKSCFRRDGPSGLPQGDTPAFGLWLDRVRHFSCGTTLEHTILETFPQLRRKLENGITLADIGSGPGRLATGIAQQFPNTSVWAIDIDETMLRVGRDRAVEKNIANIRYECADIHDLPAELENKFDHVVCYDTIHDLPSPLKAARQVRKVLKDGGTFSMVEPSLSPSLKDNLDQGGCSEDYMFSLYTCLPHSLSVEGSEGGGRSMGEAKYREIISQAGFSNFSVVSCGHMNHFICTK